MKNILIACFVFACLSVCLSAQPTPPPSISRGNSAPSSGLCNSVLVGNIYVRSGLTANIPIGVFRCTQTAAGAFSWMPIDHFVGDTLPTRCLLGDIAYKTGTSAGLYTCTATDTWTAGSGTGNVSGPASSTNTAVPRYSGTGGKTLLNSGVTIDGSNNVSVPGSVTIGRTLLKSDGTIVIPNTSTVIGGATAGGASMTVMNAYNSVFGDDAGALLAPNFTVPCSGPFWQGTANTIFGPSAQSLSTGCLNVIVGDDAGAALVSGSSNTLVGVDAGQLGTSEKYVTAIGMLAAEHNTADGMTALGYGAAQFSTGSGNTALGYEALGTATTSVQNTAVGNIALASLAGGGNTAVGYGSLNNSSGNYNTGLGAFTLAAASTPNANVAVGYFTLYGVSTGAGNTAVGYQSGYTATPANATTTGTFNTFLGYQSGPGSTTQQDFLTVIGAQATGTCSNCVVLGRSTDVTIIGTSVPSSAAASCNTGTITWGSGFVYICVTTNTWQRGAITTW